MKDIEVKLDEIRMSIKIMQELENCSYRTAQRKFAMQRRALNRPLLMSYTVLDYCLYNGKNPQTVLSKLINKKKNQ